ncbi:unnamed protein product [Urochloa decumbens]|uniref:Transcription factor CBF/NF-Y/archaeal histone domain-containing protein n=1 Tax=Urochloa decumbens TaxID=240449 RepID=A0ABC9BRI0_9POAL
MDPMDIVGKSKEDVSLPKSTMFKIIKEMLPPDVRVARDAQDLLVECCVGKKYRSLCSIHVEFINLLSSESNEVCSREEKKTIAPEHVLKALSDLGFREYIDEVYAAYEQHKLDTLDSPKAGKFTGIEMTEEEAVAEQQRMFAEARARMNNGAPKPKEPEQEPQQQPHPQLQLHTPPQQPMQPQLQLHSPTQQSLQPQLQLHPQPQQHPQVQLHPQPQQPQMQPQQPQMQPQQPEVQPQQPPQVPLHPQPQQAPQVPLHPQPQQPLQVPPHPSPEQPSQPQPQMHLQSQEPPQVQLQPQLQQAQPQPQAQNEHGADS